MEDEEYRANKPHADEPCAVGKDEREAKLIGLIQEMKSLFSKEHPEECLILFGRINNSIVRSLEAYSNEGADELCMNTIVSSMHNLKSKDEPAFYGLYTVLATVVYGLACEDDACLRVAHLMTTSFESHVNGKTASELSEDTLNERAMAFSRARFFRLMYEDLRQTMLFSGLDAVLNMYIERNDQRIQEFNANMQADECITDVLKKWIDDEEAHIQKMRDMALTINQKTSRSKNGKPGSEQLN